MSGWEPQFEAIERFNAAIAEHTGRLAAVTTHGTVMSLWLASRLNDFDPVSFWLGLRFPDAHLLRSSDEREERWVIERV